MGLSILSKRKPAPRIIAVVSAASKHKSSFVAADYDTQLLGEHGLFAALKADGYTIVGPE